MRIGFRNISRSTIKFEGEDAILNAVKFHLNYIKKDYHTILSNFIELGVNEIYKNEWKIISETETSFIINEIRVFAKKGNLCIEGEESVLHKLQQIAEQMFTTVQVDRLYEYDSELTLTITLKDS